MTLKNTLPSNVVWHPIQNYGTDGDFVYRFKRDGTLCKQPIHDKWLSKVGAELAETAKKHW